MFDRIRKEIKYRRMPSDVGEAAPEPCPDPPSELHSGLEENLAVLNGLIADSPDLIVRRFIFANDIHAAIIYIDGLADKSLMDENVMRPLMYVNRYRGCPLPESIDTDYVKNELLSVSGLFTGNKFSKIVDTLLSGDTVFLMDGDDRFLGICLRGWKSRNIDEPKTESVVRGSREGFTETLRFNTAMLRRKIKSPDFKLENMIIGERTHTEICIAYINGLARPELVDEVRLRLGRINTDAILESGYIEQYIEDAPFSIFATVGNSEKPDKVAAKLLEGRVAIFVDGTPFVLTVPCVFVESFQSSEDYYSRPFYASMIRLIRYISYFISILAPALYVALSTFHQELIPTQLLLSMAAAHEGVPFPAVLEAAVMLLFFEILREAGVRLPRSIGQAVSIVGALVIGEAAVSAGLIGAPMVIVVAITAVSSFVVPPQTDSITIIRFALLILGGFIGGFGIMIGLLVIIIHMAALRSFGTPYLMPIAPLSKTGMKDALIRQPLWAISKRPENMAVDDTRQGQNQTPSPSRKRNGPTEDYTGGDDE